MLRKILIAIVTLISVFFLVVIHTLLASLLPEPFNALHLVLLVITLLIMIQESGVILWVGFFALFILEVFRVTFFGANILAGTLAILSGLWLYRYIFTNKSWYVAIVLATLIVGMYRILYSIIVYAAGLLGIVNYRFTEAIFKAMGWEIVITALATGLVYALLGKYLKRLGTATVSK